MPRSRRARSPDGALGGRAAALRASPPTVLRRTMRERVQRRRRLIPAGLALAGALAIGALSPEPAHAAAQSNAPTPAAAAEEKTIQAVEAAGVDTDAGA